MCARQARVLLVVIVLLFCDHVYYCVWPCIHCVCMHVFMCLQKNGNLYHFKNKRQSAGHSFIVDIHPVFEHSDLHLQHHVFSIYEYTDVIMTCHCMFVPNFIELWLPFACVIEHFFLPNTNTIRLHLSCNQQRDRQRAESVGLCLRYAASKY